MNKEVSFFIPHPSALIPRITGGLLTLGFRRVL